ncbi:MAG: hypothetical protein ACI8Z7_000670 [Candidatus Nanohaloarchaea archaeon]|jgi:hypothetical protein
MVQIGTIKLQTTTGSIEVPVFEIADVQNESLRVQTENSGVGALNLVDPSNAELNQVRVQTQSNGVLAVSTTIGTVLETDTVLNGGNIKLRIHEDTDGDGQPENTETVSLNDGITSQSLSQIKADPENEIWFEVEKETSSVDTTPELQRVRIA